MENFEAKTKAENEDEEEDGSEHTEKEEQNSFFGLPPGIYHHICLNDGSRSIDLACPSSSMSFENFIDMGAYLYFLMADDKVKERSRNNTLLRMNDLTKIMQDDNNGGLND